MKNKFISILFAILIISCSGDKKEKSKTEISGKEAEILVQEINLKGRENESIFSDLFYDYKINLSESSHDKIISTIKSQSQTSLAQMSTIINLLKKYIDNGRTIYRNMSKLDNSTISDGRVATTQGKDKVFRRLNVAIDTYNQVINMKEIEKVRLAKSITDMEEQKSRIQNDLVSNVENLLNDFKESKSKKKNLDLRLKSVNNQLEEIRDDIDETVGILNEAKKLRDETKGRISKNESSFFTRWKEDELISLNKELDQYDRIIERAEKLQEIQDNDLEFALIEKKQTESDLVSFEKGIYRPLTIDDVKYLRLGKIYKSDEEGKSFLALHMGFNQDIWTSYLSKRGKHGSSVAEGGERINIPCGYMVKINKNEAINLKEKSYMSEYIDSKDISVFKNSTSEDIVLISKVYEAIEVFETRGCGMLPE